VFLQRKLFSFGEGNIVFSWGGLGTWKLLRTGWELRSGMERGGHLERKRFGGSKGTQGWSFASGIGINDEPYRVS